MLIMPMNDVQGIHDVSLMLGYEASKDLQEETFEGVSNSPAAD